jgi:thiamine biosynthesis lipoprotein
VPIEHVMGMPVRVAGDIDAGPVFAWLRWVDATFSTYRADSEISRLDRGELDDPHPLVQQVLARCEELRVETGGLFDVRAAGRLDPSGYVKGWAVERAAAFGRGRFLIDAGGDIVLRGTWCVGIRHPYEPGKLAAAITAADCAVATSGAYERGPHIIDPRTGRPATGLSSVTVVGRDLGTADAYATAAVASGDPLWTADLAAMCIAGDRVFTTRAWPRSGTRQRVRVTTTSGPRSGTRQRVRVTTTPGPRSGTRQAQRPSRRPSARALAARS